MLIDPLAHKLTTDVAFEVIAPSIPGLGFSGSPRKTGTDAIPNVEIFGKKQNWRLIYDF